MNVKRKSLQIIKIGKENPQLLILIALFAVFSLVLPNFLSDRNIINILKQASVLLIVSCGMTVVLLTGNIDLSIGSLLTLTLCVSVNTQLQNPWLAYLVPFLIAPISGLIIGFVVGKLQANAVITTIGMMVLLQGISLVYTGGSILRATSEPIYSFVGGERFLGIPIYVYIAAIFVTICGILLNSTRFGRSLYYIGVNKDAARAAGVKTTSTIVKAYLLSSIGVAIGAVILGSRLNTALATSGEGYEFEALTAVLVGGISLNGGKGNIHNTIIGVLIMTILVNGLIQLSISIPLQQVIRGLLVMVAILSESFRAGGKKKA